MIRMFPNPVISKDILKLDEGVRQKPDFSFVLATAESRKDRLCFQNNRMGAEGAPPWDASLKDIKARFAGNNI